MKNTGYTLGQVGDFEIKQLRIFKAVVESGGFSAAETALNISRSTISTHIATLEQRLNLTLCRRGRGGFLLTPEGSTIYDMALELLGSLDQFRDSVNVLSHQPAGSLRILVSDGTSLDPRCRLPEAIARFHDKAPEISLHTEVASMAEIERMVINEEADLGIIPSHRALEGLEYTHLYTECCHLYCGADSPLYSIPDHELTNEQISRMTAIAPGLKPHPNASLQLGDMSFKGTAHFYETRLAMILSGRYVGFLPQLFAAPWVEQQQLRRIQPERRYYELEVALICKKTATPQQRVVLFRNIMQQLASASG